MKTRAAIHFFCPVFPYRTVHLQMCSTFPSNTTLCPTNSKIAFTAWSVFFCWFLLCWFFLNNFFIRLLLFFFLYLFRLFCLFFLPPRFFFFFFFFKAGSGGRDWSFVSFFSASVACRLRLHFYLSPFSRLLPCPSFVVVCSFFARLPFVRCFFFLGFVPFLFQTFFFF